MKYFEAFAGVGGFSLGIERAYDSLYRRDTWTSKKRNGESSSPKQGVETTIQDSLPVRDSSSSLGAGISRKVLCVGFSEIDKYASAVLRHNYPNIKNYGNICSIKWEKVPEFDLLVGGSPCPSFSVAGKRKGLEDKRGDLIHEYVRCLREKQPKWFIFENVAGLLSHAKGETFKYILKMFSDAGYAMDFELLNAKNYCVPQNRNRVFVIGKRFDICSE